MKRRTVSLLLSCVIILSITACGGSNDDTEKTQDDNGNINVEIENDNNVSEEDMSAPGEEDTETKEETESEDPMKAKYPYFSSLDFASFPVKEIELYGGQFKLSELQGDTLLEFIDAATYDDLSDKNFEYYSSIRDILDKKVDDVKEIYIPRQLGGKENNLILKFLSTSSDDYTVGQCLEKNLWYISCEFDSYVLPRYPEEGLQDTPFFGPGIDCDTYYGGTYTCAINLMDYQLEKFGQPTYFKISGGFGGYEDAIMVYVNGDVCLYIQNGIYEDVKGNYVTYDIDGGAQKTLIIPTSLVVDGPRIDSLYIDRVLTEFINNKYDCEFRTPGVEIDY